MKIVLQEKITDKQFKDAWRFVTENGSEYVISEDDYYSKALYGCEELSEKLLEELSHNYLVKKAKSVALKMVLLRSYTTAEIGKKLLDREFDDCVIRDVVASLQNQGYLNDENYAERFVAQKMRMKPVAKQRMAFELQSKGIDRDTVCSTIEGIEQDDEEIARQLFEKRFAGKDLSDPKAYRKAVNFFLNKGFSMSIVRRIIKNSQFDIEE